MEDADKVKAYVDLYRRQMDHFEKTQEVEWKGNFGVWTLLAGAIYLFSEKPMQFHSWLQIALPALITLIHAGWLWQVHTSEDVDRKLWVIYRNEARLILSPSGTAHFPVEELKGERTVLHRLKWLVLQVGLTAALSGILVFVLRHQA